MVAYDLGCKGWWMRHGFASVVELAFEYFEFGLVPVVVQSEKFATVA